MNCWICGVRPANSGEHVLKASDLKGLFWRERKSPLYMHTTDRRNFKVQGVNSDRLKFGRSLCQECNNAGTQPYDRAWEVLSKHLRERVPPIRPGALVRLAPVFPGAVRRSMLNVHLFFLKVFGCRLIEHSVPLDIEPFAMALQNGTAHPKVFLAFWAFNDERIQKHAGVTHIQAAELYGHIRYASWFYYVGNLGVNVIYAEPVEKRMGLVPAWHPSSITKFIRIANK